MANDRRNADPAQDANAAEQGQRDLLTVQQAAEHLHLSISTIRSYIRQGKLRAFRVAGFRKVLIPRAELLKLLEPVYMTEYLREPDQEGGRKEPPNDNATLA